MYCREDGTPYYIGKGKGKRIHMLHRCGRPPVERRKYLKTNLTEEEAFRHEVYMISVLGRKDKGTGILQNMTDGGDGISGHRHTLETKRRISKNHIGITHSEETKKKISETKKQQYSRGECKTHTQGKKMSEETRRRISEGVKRTLMNKNL